MIRIPFFCFLLSVLLACSENAAAQAQTESGHYWDKRGRQLMVSGQFAKAYSAFQLARSLGAPGMIPLMEEARRRNINHILLQGLLAEARGLAETDPVQGLRLLEYAHKNFPDSNRIVRMFGDIINQPNLWLYSLKGATIWPSPQGQYVVMGTRPARLYALQGDSLVVRYTFNEPVRDVFFSPDEKFVWVITATRSILLACGKPLIQELSQPELNIEKAIFSADSRYVSLRKSGESGVRLWRLLSGRLMPTKILHQSLDSEPLFSPNGQYLFVNTDEGTGTTGQLWYLSGDQPRLLGQFSGQDALAGVVFDIRNHWMLGAGREPNTLLLADLQTDSIRTVRRFVDCHADRLSTAFSPEGSWLLLSFIRADVDSLWALATDSLQPVYAFRSEPAGESMRVISRFTPNGAWLFRSASNQLTQAQCWSLQNKVPTLIHRFQQKSSVVDDVFSADSRYFLSRHTGSTRDSLWRLSLSGPEPIHGFSTRLRTAGSDDNVAPLSCFSDDSRYLLTYHAGTTPDSLWSLESKALQPLYGFRERLSIQRCRFFSNSRWLVSATDEQNGVRLYNLSVLRAMQGPQLNSPLIDARFSANGQFMLGRTITTDSATVLYRIMAGQFRLLQKLTQPFLIGECRFLANDRLLFTYHEIGGVATGRRFANYIWRLTDAGIQPLTLLPDPAVRAVNATGGAFQFASQLTNGATTSGHNQRINRGIVASADGNYLLAHPINNRPDSLWWLSNQLQCIQDFDQRAASRTIQPGIGEPNRAFTVPEVGFVGNYLWSRSATDSGISLHRLQTNRQTQVTLPKQIGTLLGYSPISNYGVFCFVGRPDAPELWQFSARQWHFVQKLPMITKDINWNWPEKPFANLISRDGQLLIVPTTDNRLLLYRLSSQKAVLLTNQIAQVRRFSFVETDVAHERTTGLIYSDARQTHLLMIGPTDVKYTILGVGTLQLPPVCQSGRIYITRNLGDGRTAIDVLDQSSGFLLAGAVVRQFLDMTIRSTGTVWIITCSGLRILHEPAERLAWLRRSVIAPLSPDLQRNYVFTKMEQ